MKGYYKYIEDVQDGKIVACKCVRQAVDRFVRDCKDERYEFREAVADRAIAFIQALKFYEGAVAGKQFRLEGWQQFIIANLVGLYHKGEKRRKYTQAFIMVARKNGKSALISALALYYLIYDQEGAPQVLIGANTSAQAQILYKMSRTYASQLDPTFKTIIPYRSEIRNMANQGFIRTLSSRADRIDGYGPSLFIIDEYHEAPSDDLVNVLRSGQAQRQRPLGVIITTAGFDKSKPCYTLLCHCRDILAQKVENESQFALIYELDEGDDMFDERNWIKASPNLGVSVGLNYLRERVEEAKKRPSKRVDVLTKQFDLYVDSAITWVPSEYIEKATRHLTYDDFVGGDSMVFCGVDLSAVCDITALTYMTFRDGIYYFKTEYFLPADVLNGEENVALYNQFARDGHLHLTAGNVVDYDAVQAHLIGRVNDGMEIAKVSYDRYNATQWAINCSTAGLDLQPYAQNMGSMNIPTKALEMLLLKGEVVIDDNPITAWMFRNVLLTVDGNGNVRPSKEKSANKIDGVVSMLMALGGWLAESAFAGANTNQQWM